MEVVMTGETAPTAAMAGFYAAVKGLAGANNVEAQPAS